MLHNITNRCCYLDMILCDQPVAFLALRKWAWRLFRPSKRGGWAENYLKGTQLPQNQAQPPGGGEVSRG